MSKFTTSKWQMIFWSGFIQSSDTLFQSKKWFINFSTILFSLFACINYVGSSFTACQINETHFTKKFASSFYLISQNSMRTGRFCISSCFSTSTTFKSSMNNFHNFFYRSHRFFSKICELNTTFRIFQTVYFAPFI